MYSNKESATYIQPLEARLASNAKSPCFARLASYYLKEGHPQKALDLCLGSLRFFPNYATAHFVLGQCYDATGRNIEAMLEFRRALKNLPDNPTVQSMLKRSEQREQEAFRAFSEERSLKLKERKETMTFEKYVEEDVEQKESTAEFLLKRLQHVKKSGAQAASMARSHEETPSQAVSPSKIVTATLAEIYASQGEYKEAIAAYKKLVSQRPIEAERYTKRIAQLEELSKIHQSEQEG